ncbi:Hexosyltransferase [Sergentomyia squamirostris]
MPSNKRASAIVLFVCVSLFIYIYLYITWQIQFLESTQRKRNEFYSILPWQSRNLTDFIQPGHSTCHVCSQIPQICKDGQEGNSTIFFVTSAPQNQKNRAVIRSTWALNANPRPIFITGLSTNPKNMNLLLEEAQIYKDIVIEDFVDTYKNLTLKTGFILKNFLNICPKAKYVMKCDDDVMINPNIIYELIAKVPDENKPLIGRLLVGTGPFRTVDSKYYIPYWLYELPLFPPYLSGEGYLIPGEKVEQILVESFHVPLINLEDVYFTGMVSMEKLNITLQNSKRFLSHSVYRQKANKCDYRRIALLHHLEPDELDKIWKETWNENLNCNKTHIFRTILL